MLIKYLKFITKSVVIKTVNVSVSLKEFKIWNFFMIVKSPERLKQLKPINQLIKNLQTNMNSVMETLTSLFSC